MLNFDEELKKFDKSLEPDDIDEALSKADITDMSDVMFNVVKNMSNNKFLS